MAKTLSASRVVAGEPAVAALLIADPRAAEFLPNATLAPAGPSRITGMFSIRSGEDRAIDVVTAPPRRTPTAYIADFRVRIEGVPPAAGTLAVTSAGPAQSHVTFSVTAEDEIPTEFDAAFTYITDGFFDRLASAAKEQTRAA